MLLNVFMNSDNARISGSENAFGPAYVSAHGFFDAPTAKTRSLGYISAYIVNYIKQ